MAGELMGIPATPSDWLEIAKAWLRLSPAMREWTAQEIIGFYEHKLKGE